MKKGTTIHLQDSAARGFMFAMYQEKIDKLESEMALLRAVAIKAQAVWNAQDSGVDHSNGVRFARKMMDMRDALNKAGYEMREVSI